MQNLLYLTTEQLASKIGISKKTLEAMRQKGTGPRFQKFGAKVLYSEIHIGEYLEKRTYNSTSEY